MFVYVIYNNDHNFYINLYSNRKQDNSKDQQKLHLTAKESKDKEKAVAEAGRQVKG